MAVKGPNQHRRVLLKLSGEALNGAGLSGIDVDAVSRIVQDIVRASQQGVAIGLVVGGGNFWRGASKQNPILQRATADQMGMLATVMNGLALRDAFAVLGQPALLLSAVGIPGVVEQSSIIRVQEALARNEVVIFAGGTGNPFVTTDSAASLRAVEMNAQVLLKATKVDGIFEEDPSKNPQAKRFAHLSFDEVIARRLEVMDIAAFSQCREFSIPIRVFNLFKSNALYNALLGQPEGTLVD